LTYLKTKQAGKLEAPKANDNNHRLQHAGPCSVVLALDVILTIRLQAFLQALGKVHFQDTKNQERNNYSPVSPVPER